MRFLLRRALRSRAVVGRPRREIEREPNSIVIFYIFISGHAMYWLLRGELFASSTSQSADADDDESDEPNNGQVDARHSTTGG